MKLPPEVREIDKIIKMLEKGILKIEPIERNEVLREMIKKELEI